LLDVFDKNMSHKNGGGKPSRTIRPLEVVEERLSAQETEDPSTPEVESTEDVLSEEDPLTSWKRADPDQPVTLEQIHRGLVATSEYSEAAVEAVIKMASDVREISKSVTLCSEQIAILAAKIEVNSNLIDAVDKDLATCNKRISETRKEVQFLKDNMREVVVTVRQIPAIKDMLGEILSRLPDQGSK
jgi:uncharacterized coiled-coil DUF342 family protein